jgi:hypothetical protein
LLSFVYFGLSTLSNEAKNQRWPRLMQWRFGSG